MSFSLEGLVLRHAPLIAYIALCFATAALGSLAINLVRPLYLLGCLGVGILAYRNGPARSVEIQILMFATAPLLRRIADLGLGFDPTGYMLLGPLIAMLIPSAEVLRTMFVSDELDAIAFPIVGFGLCIAYGVVISMMRGDIISAASSSVKTLPPLAYCLWIKRNGCKMSEIIDGISRGITITMPLAGLYGIYQYVNPLSWDRYWMFESQMNSIGSPEPYSVRVFSIFNSPASFAEYCSFALMMIVYCRGGWIAVVSALPIGLGLLLSSSRTHWIALAIGLSYCFAFTRTQGRSGLLTLLLGTTVLVASLSGFEMADTVMQRLNTLTGSFSDDGSGAARLDQFSIIYSEIDNLLVGIGFGENGLSLLPGITLDGEVAGAIVRLGYVVGPICLSCLVCVILVGLNQVRRNAEPQLVVLGAVLVGFLFQLVFTGISSGETGFLFWLSVGLLYGTSSRRGAINVPLHLHPSKLL